MAENTNTLYRKYRPLTFDDVVGQDAIVTTLKNQIKNNKVAHAYLFCGTRGTGKTTLARILARAVNCEHKINENPCNECETCKSILTQDANLDVIEMDAASNTGIDDVRTLKEHIDYPPTMATKKVFIIDEAHALSQKACEALLKTIEEPPEYVIFILATTDPEQLKETIRSRCQRFDFKRIPLDTIKERLKYIANNENIQVEDKALEYIALKGDGSMRDAISLFDKAQLFSKGEILTYEKALDSLGSIDINDWKKLLSNIKNENVSEAIKSLKKYLDEGKDILRFVSDLIWYSRSLLIAKRIDSSQELLEVSNEKYEALKEDAKNYEVEDLIYYITKLSELLNRMKSSQEKRVLLETEIIRLCTPQTDFSYEVVMARLESLENKIKKGSFIVTNASSNEDVKTENVDEKINKIILPKATYDELQKYQNDWQAFIGTVQVDHIARGMFRLATIHIDPNDKSKFIVVCDSPLTYGVLSSPEKIEKLKEAAKKRYSKDIDYKITVDKEGISDNTIYAVEEDFKNINMEIEVETKKD